MYKQLRLPAPIGMYVYIFFLRPRCRTGGPPFSIDPPKIYYLSGPIRLYRPAQGFITMRFKFLYLLLVAVTVSAVAVPPVGIYRNCTTNRNCTTAGKSTTIVYDDALFHTRTYSQLVAKFTADNFFDGFNFFTVCPLLGLPVRFGACADEWHPKKGR